MARCPNCQHESTGRFFCDRCGALLPVTIQPALPGSVTLPDGRTVDCSAWQGVWPADGRAPCPVEAGGLPCRVYALGRTRWRDLSGPVARRAALALDTLAPLHVFPVGEAAVVVAEGLPGGRPALLDADPPGASILARLDATLAACQTIGRAVGPLHAAGFVWLDFDPAGLETADDRVALRGLDLRVFPIGEVPVKLSVSRAYAPPELHALGGEEVGPATDVFHVSLYAYYRLAGLLPRGFPGGGPAAFDFDFPELRTYRPDLPPGIAAVLRRGLSLRSADRFASVAELCDELRAAIEGARRRHESRAPVRIQVAGGSRIGAMHENLGMPNQDACGFEQTAADLLFAVVVDGVSHARLGSGDRASRIALDRLTAQLSAWLAGSFPPRPDEALTGLFLEASGAILADALTDPAATEDVDPVDVMSSTALVGLVGGNVLTLALVGDSRAYLVAGGTAEQLTVDGDVRSFELARGLPPEEVRAAGAEALALYTCLGVSDRLPEGGLVVNPERSRPAVTRWTLLPGDVVILCTDGLAEEGFFLGQADLARIVAAMQGRPPEEVVEALLAAAGACARPPSREDPFGLGDDITGVVLVVEEPSR